MKQTDFSIIIVRNVCVLTSASVIVYLFFTRSWSAIIEPKHFFTTLWSAIIGTKQPKVNQSPQQWRGRQTCTRICRFLVVGNIFRLETCMNSLAKVPPYSKLNFQGKIFFTQNWCNIKLSLGVYSVALCYWQIYIFSLFHCHHYYFYVNLEYFPVATRKDKLMIKGRNNPARSPALSQGYIVLVIFDGFFLNSIVIFCFSCPREWALTT